MTATAELSRTPSVRESSEASELKRTVARHGDTPVLLSHEQYWSDVAWLTRWLRVADNLALARALAETLHHGRPRNSVRLWTPIEDAFDATPVWHAEPPLLPIGGAATASSQSAARRSIEPASVDSNPAVAAIGDLQRWLNLTVEQIAELVGTSKSSIHYWKRENAQPRPGAARNLYRVHALIRAVRAATAPDTPLLVLTRRPEGTSPSAYDLLVAGRYDEAERLLRPLIFRRHEQPVQRPRLIASPDNSVEPPPTGLVLRPPVCRASRVRLPK